MEDRRDHHQQAVLNQCGDIQPRTVKACSFFIPPRQANRVTAMYRAASLRSLDSRQPART